MPKTSALESCMTSKLMQVWKIHIRDIVTTMDEQVDTKEAKDSPWSKTSKIELWISLQKKKKSQAMPITSHNRYLIYSCNINTMPAEPNWIMHIPSAYYVWKSNIMWELGIPNQVTIVCFCLALCWECLDSMIWKLGLSPPASCNGYTMHCKTICTCHFRILPSWVQRDHSSWKYW